MRFYFFFLGLMGLLVFSGRAQVSTSLLKQEEDYRSQNRNSQPGRFPIAQKLVSQPMGSDSKPQPFSFLSTANSWFLCSDSTSVFYWGDSLRITGLGLENPCFGVLLPKTFSYRPDSIFLQLDFRFQSNLQYDSLKLSLQARDSSDPELSGRLEFPIPQSRLSKGFFLKLNRNGRELSPGSYLYFQLSQPAGRAPFWGDVWIRELQLKF